MKKEPREIERFILDKHREGYGTTQIARMLPEHGFKELSHARVSQIIKEVGKNS